jgi:hypothetical protein
MRVVVVVEVDRGLYRKTKTLKNILKNQNP